MHALYIIWGFFGGGLLKKRRKLMINADILMF